MSLTPEQLAERRRGLGGSDAAGALGLSKFQDNTPLNVYLSKIGERETLETEPMYWGSAKEQIIRQRYANDNQITVIQPPTIWSEEYPWMLANVDGMPGDEKILECKTARSSEGWGEIGSDEIPDDYMLQTQHYLIVTKRVVADVAVLIGSSDYRVYTVEADKEIQEMLIEGEAQFWQRVLDRNPPDAKTLSDMKYRWPRSRGVRKQADALIAAACERLALLNGLSSQIADEQIDIKLLVQGYMEDADTLVGADGKNLITWKTSKPSMKFDLDAFRAEHPELATQFTVAQNPARPFLLKLKGEDLCPPGLLTETLRLHNQSPASAKQPKLIAQ